MEEYENHKTENTQKAEFQTENDTVRDSLTDDNSESAKENHGVHPKKTEVVDKEVSDSVAETEPSLSSIKPVTEELAQVTENLVQNLLASDAAQMEPKVEKATPMAEEIAGAIKGLELNGNQQLVNENNEASTAVSDTLVKGVEEATLPASDGKVEDESSEAAALESKETDDPNLLQPADVTTGVDTREIPKSTENQPFVAATPRTRTSWMGCCGLFDVLSRPNQ